MSPACASVEAMKRVPTHTPVDDLRDQRHAGNLAGVAAGFGALGDNCVEAAVFAGLRVTHRAAHVHHFQTRGVEAVDKMARRHAQA
jgi:hypothetical protein